MTSLPVLAGDVGRVWCLLLCLGPNEVNQQTWSLQMGCALGPALFAQTVHPVYPGQEQLQSDGHSPTWTDKPPAPGFLLGFANPHHRKSSPLEKQSHHPEHLPT